MKIAALFVSASSLFLLLAIPGVATAGERQEFAEEARFYIAAFAGMTRPEDLQNVTRQSDGAGGYDYNQILIVEHEDLVATIAGAIRRGPVLAVDLVVFVPPEKSITIVRNGCCNGRPQ